MIRIVIEHLLLFLLPTLIYIAYHVLIAQRGGSVSEALDGAPLFWLSAAGAIVVVLFIAYFATFEGGRPGESYFPPVERDGQIIEGGSRDTAAPDATKLESKPAKP